MKETEGDTNGWRDIPCSWTARINLQPQVLYRCHAIPIQMPVTVFTELEQKIFKFVQKTKDPQITKKYILKKKNRAEGITVPSFRIYYKATTMKTVWQRHKKQTHRPREKHRKHRNKPRHLGSINLLQRKQEYNMELGVCG